MKQALLLAAVALVGGCKKKTPSALWAAREYRDRVCACKDAACITAANEELARSLPRGGDQLSEDETRQLQSYAAQANDCISKATGAIPERPLPTQPSPLPTTPTAHTADALLAAARTWQRINHPKLAVWSLEAMYVDQAGTLDAEYGEVRVELRTTSLPDDPKRKTGAPVAIDTTPAQCPQLRWKDTWTADDESCATGATAYTPKCTVEQIWKRAIAQGAPADALAAVTFTMSSGPSWTFDITDNPRNVHVHLPFDDDCERALEKSP